MPTDLRRLPSFRGVRLDREPHPAVRRAAAADYEAICAANTAAILARFERHGGAYPFVDAKLDLRTGADVPADDVLRGRGTIYGWIQGRGLEALAGHARWAEAHADAAVRALAPRLRAIAAAVLASLQRLRARNDGHLFFFMAPDGAPFVLGADGGRRRVELTRATPSGYSDLFGAKGVFAAARLLGDAAAEAQAVAWMARVSADIRARAFTSDQQSLDPSRPIAAAPGCHPQGPYMIQLGACALVAEAGRREAIAEGLWLLRHELTTHASPEGDFWEFVDDDDRPLRQADGTLLCDPGHALEFVGLALKFARAVRASGLATDAQRDELGAAVAPLARILCQAFALGYQPGPGGICKACDLVTRRPLNTDMPWWNLPETIRAAALCWREVADPEAQRACLRIWAACHNAFFAHYLRPEVHLMAVQTRAADGSVSPSIPATADADPGYHTGLSLLDVVALVRDEVDP